ncbi:MAG: hypothetical protein UY04_C0054G0007 [Parcubacteria group bacterium GW2011_GWA2_47_7]|nr:MAG: hypothetical protein UY04_C0054G0007 [Parcubacteria group bacterium GW2011_GWA2_47_7]
MRDADLCGQVRDAHALFVDFKQFPVYDGDAFNHRAGHAEAAYRGDGAGVQVGFLAEQDMLGAVEAARADFVHGHAVAHDFGVAVGEQEQFVVALGLEGCVGRGLERDHAISPNSQVRCMNRRMSRLRFKSSSRPLRSRNARYSRAGMARVLTTLRAAYVPSDSVSSTPDSSPAMDPVLSRLWMPASASINSITPDNTK